MLNKIVYVDIHSKVFKSKLLFHDNFNFAAAFDLGETIANDLFY